MPNNMLADLLVPPRLRSIEGDNHRHSTWLELFYDLVFVAAISQLASLLFHDYTPRGLLKLTIVYVPIWWAWIGHTFYLSRFDTTDLGHRLLTMLQIGLIAATAVQVPHALDEHSGRFAICYVLVRLVLVLQYWRAGHHVPQAKALTTRFATGFGLAALVWLISLAFEPPLRFGLWAIGLGIDFLTPIMAGKLHAKVPPHFSHLPERFGLFTIIVLGEAVVAVVHGAEKYFAHALAIASAVLSLVLAFALWWLYFDSVRATEAREVTEGSELQRHQIWLYAHLPLTMGITTVAVGIERALHLAPGKTLPFIEGSMLGIAVGICLLCLNLILLHSPSFTKSPYSRRDLLPQYAVAFLVIVVGCLLATARPVLLIGMLAFAGVVQVALSLRIQPMAQGRDAEV